MKRIAVGIATIALLPLINSGAFAQCVTTSGSPVANFAGISQAATAVGLFNTANTVFLTQTSAFTAGTANPAPDQPGGGVWARGVAGHEQTSATANVVLSSTPPQPGNTGTATCSTSFTGNYVGAQVGADIAKYNVSAGPGGNIYVGITGGYLTASGTSNTDPTTGAALSGRFDIPFVGAYVAYTNGSFFSDVLYRHDFYSVNGTDATIGLNSSGSGNANSVTGSAGYQFKLGNSGVFFEPSGSLVLASLDLDPLPGTNGVLTVDEIHSLLGRAGARVGTSFVSGNVAWSPFVAANVFHEFDGAATAAIVSPGVGMGAPLFTTQDLTVNRVGTFGQYGLGIAGASLNSPWVGYARFDFRDGEQIEGWAVNFGARYRLGVQCPC